MRELLKNDHKIHEKFRITPACAGITHAIFKTQFFVEDHPRVCGNYGCGCGCGCGCGGSPPRVRELHDKKLIHKQCIRITPACAGITGFFDFFCNIFQDHPRVCGNYGFGHILEGLRAGSPPRVRELLYATSCDFQNPRITPACAGITLLITSF